MDFITVRRFNTQINVLNKVLELAGISINDLTDRDDSLLTLKQLGIDASLLNLEETSVTCLNLDQVVSVDNEIVTVPGFEKKGFAVWFSAKPEDCWYLDESDYKLVMESIR